MASLCRKPKLLSSLQGILEVVNITSHSQRHERNLERIRALLVDPTDRIQHDKNIWNLGIIDNVDFKEGTFGYGNIFDAIRDFNENDIYTQIMTHFEVGSKLPPPNVIILNAGDPLSNDSAVDKCLRMYLTEIGMENNGNINVVADEAIFRRENDPLLRKMLHIAPSVNLTSPGHFFAYDEALEIFESENPLENPVFEFCNNLNDDGVNQLVTAYDIGIKRLQTIVNQEILLTEHYTTVGRRARNIIRVTVADITKMKKEKKIEMRKEKEKEKRKGRERERERESESKRGSGSGRGSGKGSGTRKRRRRK
ncbi:hypothetical protein RhiirA1_403804 [Rhizophagus irregularis]|uniref:Uncharacterized protein n=1 Tax=Rhizophagus irregularis TaxID=588596 RepID=A0A2I1FF47_9GLOM|nr:hypothetical protein RhiirA1_403804 [Rhizophagus irregularis]PKY33001.1 hypothetical protein RhiirB3_493539 [Rhizophagus irregularis]